MALMHLKQVKFCWFAGAGGKLWIFNFKRVSNMGCEGTPEGTGCLTTYVGG